MVEMSAMLLAIHNVLNVASIISDYFLYFSRADLCISDVQVLYLLSFY